MTRGETPADRLERALRRPDRPALIAFAVAGDPDLDFTARLVPALAEAGADAIELGMPFSDPLADGPVIQRAGARALAGGIRLDAVFALASRMRAQGVTVPFLLLSYINPLLQYGLGRAMEAAARSGFEGVIVPDVPAEERGPLAAACAAHGLAAVAFAAPTTDVRRIERIAREARGFLYCVSVTGVTGARQALPAEALALLDRARATSPAPVALGFGLSTPAQLRAVAPHADAVIVGSALIEQIEAHLPDRAEAVAAARGFIRRMVAALDEVSRRPS